MWLVRPLGSAVIGINEMKAPPTPDTDNSPFKIHDVHVLNVSHMLTRQHSHMGPAAAIFRHKMLNYCGSWGVVSLTWVRLSL